MPSFEGLTGPITFDFKGKRANYTIDIYRSSVNMPLANVRLFFVLIRFDRFSLIILISCRLDHIRV